MLESLGQEEDVAIYFSIHSPGLGRREEGEASPVEGLGAVGVWVSWNLRRYPTPGAPHVLPRLWVKEGSVECSVR